MARDTLTGSRIRERRLIAGLRQADLARRVGISASYLNLIEHNRRRIGGKLLLDIAQVLGVEPSILTEGAEAALVAGLREAAADADTGSGLAETDRTEEFAGRFPGWAEVLIAGHRRIATLERTVETLSDRLTHDPHLAASLHEVLSTATAIRSTASILAETGGLEAEWRDRFHANLNEDSLRLAESSKALMGYLDDSETGEERRGAPQEEAEAFVAANDHHFPDIETGKAAPEDIVGAAEGFATEAARQISKGILKQYQIDARLMPYADFCDAMAQHGVDPVALARVFHTDLPSVFRRLASVPEQDLNNEVGLVVCDASGSILFRRPVPGFALPRYGASCPLWPLFAAFGRPMVPIRRRVSQLGRSAAQFDCLAVAWPQEPLGFEENPHYRSYMLILPVRGSEAAEAGTQIDADASDLDIQQVGSSCRVCPSRECSARREPSILRQGF